MKNFASYNNLALVNIWSYWLLLNIFHGTQFKKKLYKIENWTLFPGDRFFWGNERKYFTYSGPIYHIVALMSLQTQTLWRNFEPSSTPSSYIRLLTSSSHDFNESWIYEVFSRNLMSHLLEGCKVSLHLYRHFWSQLKTFILKEKKTSFWLLNHVIFLMLRKK